MSASLVINVVALILMLVLLATAEHALMRWTRRHLDRSRRVVRALVFLAGIGVWGFVSYISLFRFQGERWFIAFLIVAGVWKLTVDVVLFGAADQMRS